MEETIRVPGICTQKEMQCEAYGFVAHTIVMKSGRKL
jgi:hypothetical protein